MTNRTIRAGEATPVTDDCNRNETETIQTHKSIAAFPFLAALVLALALVLLVGACAPKTPELRPPVEPPAAFSVSGTDIVPSRWWTAFDDPVLDRLVDEALRSNFDLAASWQRLRAARFLAEQAGADLWPELDATLDYSAQRGISESAEFRPDDELRLGAAASYELDLWGRIGSSVEAERLRAEATHAEVRAAALSLAAEVTQTYFQLREARRQVSILNEQLEAGEQVEKLLGNRFDGGQVRAVDVLRQRGLVEAIRDRLDDARARRHVLENLLAVLVGRAPQTFSISDLATGLDDGTNETNETNETDEADEAFDRPPGPILPPLPDTGLPAELVRRRPDVESAHLRLRAADRDLATALANRYPRLTISASLSTTDDQAGDLFDDWTRAVAGGLLAPIFRGGELAAAADRAEAVRRQRLYEYGQATLEAFREVEDALVRELQQTKRVASLERQLELSRQATEQLRRSYLNGLGDYIDVLVSQTETQRLEQDVVTARRVLREVRVGLYRALAGGFDLRSVDSAETDPAHPADPVHDAKDSAISDSSRPGSPS